MIPLRLARELTYPLEKAGENDRLARALASVPVFRVLYLCETNSDVLTLWQQLAARGHEPEKYYPVSLDVLRKSDSPLLPDALQNVVGVFETRGNWDIRMELLTELLAWAETHEDQKRAMQALARYTSLYSRIPKFEFCKRITELKGKRIPMSADDD